MAPETGKENPAPASIGAGAGAISLSWAETTANVTITRRSKNAREIVTWVAAIANDTKRLERTKKERLMCFFGKLRAGAWL
jgi:hypothetical protein